MAIRALVWGENFHECNDPAVGTLYPRGIHGAIAEQLRLDPEIEAAVATFDQDEQGLAAERLAATDVLLWWGHRRHQEVGDDAALRVIGRVWEGMGLIVLHSGHLSKVFRQLMGTACTLKWRVAGERERLWVAAPHHPIAAGLGDGFEIENEEMYGEPFAVPEPHETIFISSFAGGEVFRSGLTWRRGGGKIFYFQPGHQTYPTYHHPQVGQVLRNGVRWAAPPPLSSPLVP